MREACEFVIRDDGNVYVIPKANYERATQAEQASFLDQLGVNLARQVARGSERSLMAEMWANPENPGFPKN